MASTQRGSLDRLERYIAKVMRIGAVFVCVLLLVLAVSVAGGALWWYCWEREGVVTYLKIPRDDASLISDSPAIGDEHYRQIRYSHKALLTSPLVVGAAIQRQDIANLEVVRSHDLPDEWLSNALELSFPDDSEVLEVFLPCSQSESQEHVKLLDAVIQAYVDKVLLQERLDQAAAVTDFRLSIKELEERLHMELKELHTLKKMAVTPEDAAHVTMLQDASRIKRQLLRDLKRKALTLELEEQLAAKAERSGNNRPGAVTILQQAVWTVDPPVGLNRYHPAEKE